MHLDPVAFLDRAFSALSHPGRRAILHLLLERGPQRAVQIAREFPRVCHETVQFHLRELCAAGLITVRRGTPVAASRSAAAQAGESLRSVWEGRLADARKVYYSASQPGLNVALGELLELNGANELAADMVEKMPEHV